MPALLRELSDVVLREERFRMHSYGVSDYVVIIRPCLGPCSALSRTSSGQGGTTLGTVTMEGSMERKKEGDGFEKDKGKPSKREE